MNWERLYHLLFNRITDALEELDRRNYGNAGELLREAQREAEELYLEEEESFEE